MSPTSEFKDFAMKRNVVDLGVGVIIGGACGKIIDAVVKALIMLVVGKTLGGLDFSNHCFALSNPPATLQGPMTVEALTKAGVPVLASGDFITVAANLIIMAFIFFLLIRQINRLKSAGPAPVAAPPATHEDVLLLHQIRDALAK